MVLVNLRRRKPRSPQPMPVAPPMVGDVSAAHWSWRYVVAALAPAVSGAAFLLFEGTFRQTTFLVYMPAVFVGGLYGGFGPGVLATALSCALAASLARPAPETAALGMFFIFGVLTSTLHHALHEAVFHLREGQWRLNFLVENVRDYAIFLITPEGRVATWNAGAQRSKGYAADEIVGKPFETFFTPEDRAAGRPAAALRHARERGTHSEEGWRVRKNGTRFWASASLTAVRGERGELIGFAKVTRDLTDLKRSEEALRRTIADLESFAYTVSHDLRAPLRAIEGFTEIVAQREAGRVSPESARLLERVAAAAKRMDRLIRDVLLFARLQRDEYRAAPVDLDALVEHVLGHYAALKDAPIDVRRPLGRACGNESLIMQVLSNLLTNAVKFSPKGAPIEVRVERRGARARLIVEDRGPGIPPDALSRIFEPFTRLESDRHVEGTGIGLAIVRRAAERMGGEAGVESELGKGSRFWVELPPC